MHYSLRLELPWAPGVNRRLIPSTQVAPFSWHNIILLPIFHECLVVPTYPILLVTCMIYSITVSLYLAEEINYSILFYSSCSDENMMEVIVTMTRRWRRLSLKFKNDNGYAMILEDHIYHNRNELTVTEITI